MAFIQALVGFASLFFGRLLFWLFVGAAGFVVGVEVTLAFLGEQAFGIALIIALIAGVLGSIVATFAQRVAVAIAGFVAGGYFLLNLVNLGGLVDGPSDTLPIVLVFAGGVIGAVLVSLLFDAALIVLSSALGATLLTQAVDAWFNIGRPVILVVFTLLFIVGVVVQWGSQERGRERGGARPGHEGDEAYEPKQ